MRVPRTTGAFSGTLIVLLGAWGALVPFFGPYFHYAFGGDQTWHFTTQRLWLCIVPGAVAVIGGIMLLRATTRVAGLTAGWVALAAGAWFAVGPSVSLLWHHTTYAIGAPAGGYTRQMIEWVGYFYGLGAVMIGLAAFAMGRFFSRPRIVEEPIVAAEAATAGQADPVAMTGAATADRPVADRPAAEEPMDERPVADEPVADRPVADGPAGERAGYAPASDAPAASEAPAARAAPADPPTTTSYQPTATTYRRRPGLMRRLRGQ
jgi:hypothetical protein